MNAKELEKQTSDPLQREVLRRLAEAQAKPFVLEPFEKADLDKLITKILHAQPHAQ